MCRIIIREGFPIPRGASAITIGNSIFVRADKVTDELLAHEKVHVSQFNKQPWTFWIRYLFSKEHRKHYEAEAYAESVRKGMHINQAAMLLRSNLYGLSISYPESINIINKYLK